MLKKILKNTIWLSADQVLRLAMSFFIGAWVARYLQPQQYGLLNYAIGFVGLFSPLAYLHDLNQIVIRDITLEPNSKNEILGTCFIIKIFGSLVTFLLSIGAVFWLRNNDELAQLLVVILSLSTIFYSFNTIDCWFQHQLQSKYTVIAKNLIFVTITLIKIFLIHVHASLIAFAWLILLESFGNSLALVIAYYINGQELTDWSTSLARAKKLITNSWTLILSGLAISVYLRIDQIMLGQMIGDYAVGIYSIGVRLSEICCFVPSAIVTSVVSSIIATKNHSESEFYRRIQHLFNIMVLMAYTLAFSMIFISKLVVDLLYGENYAATSDVVIIHIWSITFMFLGFAKNIWVISENKGVYALVSTLSGAIINILLNLWLIPYYQAIGAAIATLISYAFADYITCFIYTPARKIFWMMTKSITLTFLIPNVSK